MTTWVWIEYGNGLILVCIVPNNALSQYIEWSAQKDVIGGATDDMDLDIESHVADLDWNIAREPERLIWALVVIYSL